MNTQTTPSHSQAVEAAERRLSSVLARSQKGTAFWSEITEAINDFKSAIASQQEVAAPVGAWQEINMMELTDELVWLRRGDYIDGPRSPETDDYDRYERWAPCEPPLLKAASRVPVASLAEPEGDVQLRACDQTTGREYFIKKGPRSAMQAEADAMNEKGRDYFVIPPAQPKAPVPGGTVAQGEAPLSDDEQHELWMQITGGDSEGWESAREFARRLHATHANMAVGAVGGVGAPIEDSLTQEDAIQLLCVRDYLEAGNAGHALYAFAHFFDHEGAKINPWQRLEERALPWKSEGAATPAPEQATTGSGQELTKEEAELLDTTIEQFCDCGETDTPYEKLLDWANRGFLECERFLALPAAQTAIDAARLSTASPAGEGEGKT